MTINLKRLTNPTQDLPGNMFAFDKFGHPVYAPNDAVGDPAPFGTLMYVVAPPLVTTPTTPTPTITLDPLPLYLSSQLNARPNGATTKFDTRAHSRQ